MNNSQIQRRKATPDIRGSKSHLDWNFKLGVLYTASTKLVSPSAEHSPVDCVCYKTQQANYFVLNTHPFNGPLSGTTWVTWYQKKPSSTHTHEEEGFTQQWTTMVHCFGAHPLYGALSQRWFLDPTILFHKCCSCCRFQPYDCVIVRFVEQIQSTLILIMGTCRQCGSWSVTGHNHKKVIGWDCICAS